MCRSIYTCMCMYVCISTYAYAYVGFVVVSLPRWLGSLMDVLGTRAVAWHAYISNEPHVYVCVCVCVCVRILKCGGLLGRKKASRRVRVRHSLTVAIAKHVVAPSCCRCRAWLAHAQLTAASGAHATP
ncbi:hypothetical protein GGS23DRAFT_113429 [Durotheca rogersii]|uniref:uncharacterized protein n=1 Tax=Durotheca rogersii TaxID=419775 RepID=UPI00221F6CA0|nr:uncharacterized protein GGS23DRAFT_113429 [Durotheca rogersii]KAI5862242.1 hypothetical protein GGS23DRAFT_113429 [Durotheca rogersii]